MSREEMVVNVRNYFMHNCFNPLLENIKNSLPYFNSDLRLKASPIVILVPK